MGLLILRSAGSAGGGGEEPGEWVGKTAHYVRQGASGTGSGNDWTNAYTTLPAALTRDHVYYIADSTTGYGAYTYNDATSGSLKIYIVKATASDHGTDVGWDSSYGDGVAEFNGEQTFQTSHWVWDGQTGGGPDSWQSGFGFQINCDGSNGIVFENATNTHAFRHFKILGTGVANDDRAIESISGRTTGATFSYFSIEDIGFIPFYFVPVSDVIVEYGYVGDFHYNQAAHSETASIWGGPSNVTFRYCILTCISDSTGGLMFDSSETTGSPKVTMFVYGCVWIKRPGTLAWVGPANGLIGGWDSSGSELENVKVYHCTFINIPEEGGDCLSSHSIQINNEAKNNLFLNCPNTGSWQTNSHNHFINTSTFGTNTSTSVGDPHVDIDTLDFRLTEAIPDGTPLGAPYNVDMYGNTRNTRGAVGA